MHLVQHLSKARIPL